MNKRHFQLFQYSFSCVVLLLLFAVTSSGYSQGDTKELRSKEVIDIVAKGMSEANDKKKVGGYLDAFFDMWKDESNQVNLPYYRSTMLEMLKKISNQSNSAYRAFVDMVYSRALELSKSGNFVVKYNALLLLGDLNESQEPGKPAVPYSAAREELLKVLKAKLDAPAEAAPEKAAPAEAADGEAAPAKESSKSGNLQQSQQATLKIAAMRGLARHANRKLQISSDAKKKLLEAFDEYAFSAEAAENAASEDGKNAAPTADQDSSVAEWLRELAIQGIGDIGDAGVKGSRINKLYGILTKSQRYSFETRMAAAVALSKLNMEVTFFTEAKPMEVITAIAKMAAEAMKYECIDRRYSLKKSSGDVALTAKKKEEKSNDIVPITSEEQEIQIRFLRQRMKYLTSTFSAALSRSEKNPWERLLDNNDKEKYAKIAKAFRTLNETCDYDSFEKTTKKDRANANDESTKKAQDSTLTYELAQERILKELKVLYGILGMDASGLKVPKAKTKAAEN